jgi:hypothetical protein
MRPIATALAIALAACLAACATATPYQPLARGNAVTGGFTDERLDDTHFRVTFKGNDMTSRMRVENYLLYRAAELTADQGYDWFEMVDHHTHDSGSALVTPAFGGRYGWGYWRPSWTYFDGPGFEPFGGPMWGAYDLERIDAYQATADIAVGHGPKPAGDPRAFDARQVMANLGPKIVRPS